VPATDRFGFTKLLVADLEVSARFYTTVFGLQERGRVRSEIADRKIDEIMFEPQAPGAASFVLLHFEGVTSPSSDEVILGFVTADVSQLVARVERAGGTVVAPARKEPDHGVLVAFVTDNEGHLIEVVEMLPPP
jgi:predicted enzyme related to lactoylglutathione lyase